MSNLIKLVLPSLGLILCLTVELTQVRGKPANSLLGDFDPLSEEVIPPIDCTTSDDDEGARKMQARNGLINPRYRWSNFRVYVDPAYDDRERSRIQEAMDRLAAVLPCVNFAMFPPGTQPAGDYIHIKKESGCWSYVGKLGGKQDMSLQSPGCMGVGTIMHEMIHALGFYHEQSRPDRDDYVTVLWGNILSGMENNFIKRSSTQVTSFGIPYNMKSIMHYSSRAFSRNGQPTITGKNGELITPSQDLEPTDIEKLKKMYNC